MNEETQVNENEEDIELMESLEYVLSNVPPQVRDFVLTKLSAAVQTLMTRYNLHIDQAGVLQSALILLLTGKEGPNQFSVDLMASGVDPDIVTKIVADVNREIFMPIRNQEQTPQAPLIPPVRQEPSRPQAPAVPAPVITPPPPPAPPAPPPPMRVVKLDIPQTPVVAPRPAPVPEPVISAPTLPPPPNLPGIPEPITKPYIPQMPAATPIPPAPQNPITKTYGVDPYRELPE